jgi:transcriptional regulator with XRE-family HTH domain
MPAKKPLPKVIADNLRALMLKRGWSDGDLAAKAGVDKKTVNNMVNGRHATQTDKLELVAKAFGLHAWELLVEGMGDAQAHDGKLENLIEAYAKTDDSGRDSMLKVAEIAIRPYKHD